VKTRIVFDMAAVLFHWQPRQMLMRVLPQWAGDETRAAHWEAELFQGWQGDWADFDRGHIGVNEVVHRIATRSGLPQADVRMAVQAIPLELQPMPDTVALLHRLADAGHELHFLSNMPRPFVPRLDRHAFFQRFASGIWSGHVGLSKPQDEIYALAEERFGAAPEELLFLDDSPANVEAAQARGWQALVFTDAAAAEATLRHTGVTAIS
jgi:putative hydrolase of the HAD superfamily